MKKHVEGDSLEVPEHVSSTEQHGCGVCNVPSNSLCKWVACTLKKKKMIREMKNCSIRIWAEKPTVH